MPSTSGTLRALFLPLESVEPVSGDTPPAGWFNLNIAAFLEPRLPNKEQVSKRYRMEQEIAVDSAICL